MRLPVSQPVFCVHWKPMLSQRAGKLRLRNRKLAARPDLARERAMAVVLLLDCRCRHRYKRVNFIGDVAASVCALHQDDADQIL